MYRGNGVSVYRREILKTVRHGDTETRGHGVKSSPHHRVTASWMYLTNHESPVYAFSYDVASESRITEFK